MYNWAHTIEPTTANYTLKSKGRWAKTFKEIFTVSIVNYQKTKFYVRMFIRWRDQYVGGTMFSDTLKLESLQPVLCCIMIIKIFVIKKFSVLKKNISHNHHCFQPLKWHTLSQLCKQEPSLSWWGEYFLAPENSHPYPGGSYAEVELWYHHGGLLCSWNPFQPPTCPTRDSESWYACLVVPYPLRGYLFMVLHSYYKSGLNPCANVLFIFVHYSIQEVSFFSLKFPKILSLRLST